MKNWRSLSALVDFCKRRDGAVTVDFIVLTAACVLLAVFAASSIVTGGDFLATKIANTMNK
ncbi:hypothetical protein BV394_03565 [Brevirhabdus pacifica]|uniref:Uncharacterized protein n=1 Tax=Brevirhabdus pacifica TaxID=1267768 RepID=A0A1U7DGB5_9RHOB|nr:hypothetical protein [Brevirhabdus pacifica]APX88918.1 hypothetical protein BV394_03565 [Brevirhabdus pacifica]OWU80147.1 hypothetical protein ATO5_04250 [Loktanella sp. 22II-4b]PJJ86532.1 hypothetical protein CLV77_1079 [Brevirhabdus pacifica]